MITTTPGVISDKHLFAYCDNNPSSRKDDGGDVWNIVVGAIIGGTLGGISTAISLSCSGQDYTVNQFFGQVAVSTACGAISGAIAGTGLGVFGQAAVGAALGATESACNQLIGNGTINASEVNKSALCGFVGGWVSGSGAANSSKHVITQRKLCFKNTNWKSLHSVSCGFRKYIGQTWNYSKKNLWRTTLMGIGHSFVANKVFGGII